MFSFVADLMYRIGHIMPVNVWVTVIIIFTVIFRIAGEGWLTFPKLVLGLIVLYYFLRLLAFVLPNWLELVIFITMIIGVKKMMWG
ncbi:MAG: hypothetical protein IJ215_00925 [Clostridia bacterium]|nr:hypothetical protein [Clostridia bacterium]